MSNRPSVRGRWNQRQAAVKQKMRHDIKLGVANKFKTRTHGTSKQVGKVFPTGNKLPVASREKLTSAYPASRYPNWRRKVKAETKEMLKMVLAILC